MNYQKIYDDLITKRKNQPIDNEQYSEKHHIIPRSIGGSESLPNIVKLTAREHYVAHLLLTQMFENGSSEQRKMLNAFMMMSLDSWSTERTFHKSSRLYERLKIDWIDANRQKFKENQTGTKNSQFGTKWINKDGVDKKIKESKLPDFLKNGWSVGRTKSQSVIIKTCKFCGNDFETVNGKYCSISCANSDRKLSSETKKRISESKIGHIVTAETRNKISKSQRKYYQNLK